ncbi:MAG: hypothetical protein IJT59_08125 [Desulfovibrionaceae bacterium]|nr:hypothetical protein [Desulfovibrionaceae bacterium]
MVDKLKWYKEVLELDPNTTLFLNLALLQEESGAIDDAISTIRDGLKRHPNHMEARIYYCELLYKANLSQEFLSEMHNLHEMFSRYVDFWRGWAAFMSDEKNSSDAASILRFMAAYFRRGSISLSEVINRGLEVLSNEDQAKDRALNYTGNHTFDEVDPVTNKINPPSAQVQDLDKKSADQINSVNESLAFDRDANAKNENLATQADNLDLAASVTASFDQKNTQPEDHPESLEQMATYGVAAENLDSSAAQDEFADLFTTDEAANEETIEEIEEIDEELTPDLNLQANESELNPTHLDADLSSLEALQASQSQAVSTNPLKESSKAKEDFMADQLSKLEQELNTPKATPIIEDALSKHELLDNLDESIHRDLVPTLNDGPKKDPTLDSLAERDVLLKDFESSLTDDSESDLNEGDFSESANKNEQEQLAQDLENLPNLEDLTTEDPDLVQADLGHENLDQANLSEESLSLADLDQADLVETEINEPLDKDALAQAQEPLNQPESALHHVEAQDLEENATFNQPDTPFTQGASTLDQTEEQTAKTLDDDVASLNESIFAEEKDISEEQKVREDLDALSALREDNGGNFDEADNSENFDNADSLPSLDEILSGAHTSDASLQDEEENLEASQESLHVDPKVAGLEELVENSVNTDVLENLDQLLQDDAQSEDLLASDKTSTDNLDLESSEPKSFTAFDQSAEPSFEHSFAAHHVDTPIDPERLENNLAENNEDSSEAAFAPSLDNIAALAKDEGPGTDPFDLPPDTVDEGHAPMAQDLSALDDLASETDQSESLAKLDDAKLDNDAAQAKERLQHALDTLKSHGMGLEMPKKSNRPAPSMSNDDLNQENFLKDPDLDPELLAEVSTRTRSMAEILAEQGDINGALDIYYELETKAQSQAEIDDLRERIDKLNAKLPSAPKEAVKVEENEPSEDRNRVLNLLEALSERLEARAQL